MDFIKILHISFHTKILQFPLTYTDRQTDRQADIELEFEEMQNAKTSTAFLKRREYMESEKILLNLSDINFFFFFFF